MRSINSQDDFAQLLQCDEAVLYIYVDWSVYAREGLQIVEEAERFLTANLTGNRPSGSPM
jgi:hypothetical protein